MTFDLFPKLLLFIRLDIIIFFLFSPSFQIYKKKKKRTTTK